MSGACKTISRASGRTILSRLTVTRGCHVLYLSAPAHLKPARYARTMHDKAAQLSNNTKTGCAIDIAGGTVAAALKNAVVCVHIRKDELRAEVVIVKVFHYVNQC